MQIELHREVPQEIERDEMIITEVSAEKELPTQLRRRSDRIRLRQEEEARTGNVHMTNEENWKIAKDNRRKPQKQKGIMSRKVT